jgi:hypothetical protein
LSIKKIGGAGPPEVPGSGEASGPERPREAHEAFTEHLKAAAGAGTDDQGGLQAVVLEAVQSVRRGDLEPEAALESIIQGSREILRAELPAEVDIDDVLEYIRETLEGDPAFMALVKGSAPSGT